MRRTVVDRKDRKLLSILLLNSREKLVDLAAALDISVTAVNKRLRKLEKMGIIRRYSVNLDFTKLGFGIIALVRMAIEPAKRNNVINELKKVRNILEFYEVSGDYDIVAKVIARDIDEYRDGVLTRLSKIDGIKKTSSMIVMGEHYCDPRLLLGDVDDE
ncbi:MAG: Lrp/AsnC family transcriptional regulator [Euryarchaeota archaeon]|nr:Lrp/AsnC family transcriptional regulator [Euryarchaeota archaeon]MCD6158272.1 Lrp/AsnC family transcriptional regulator [Euryarchaeota archaeon]